MWHIALIKVKNFVKLLQVLILDCCGNVIDESKKRFPKFSILHRRELVLEYRIIDSCKITAVGAASVLFETSGS
jgi:hypothetical protein